jgi:hypothetical protein
VKTKTVVTSLAEYCNSSCREEADWKSSLQSLHIFKAVVTLTHRQRTSVAL